MLAWIIDGLSDDSSLTSIDNNLELISIANEFFGEIKNVEVIFADAWRGKCSELGETLNLLKVGGFYVIDDITQ